MYIHVHIVESWRSLFRHTHTHNNNCTHARTRARTHTHTQVRRCRHTHIHTNTLTHVHTRTQTQTNACMHTYIHMYTYVYTRMQAFLATSLLTFLCCPRRFMAQPGQKTELHFACCRGDPKLIIEAVKKVRDTKCVASLSLYCVGLTLLSSLLQTMAGFQHQRRG